MQQLNEVRRHSERRQAPRFRNLDHGVQAMVLQHYPPKRAQIEDISTHGIRLGFHTDRPVEVGSELTLELYHPLRKFWDVKQLRVLTAQPQEDGSWRVSGMFLKQLTENDLCGLLRPKAGE
jgi:hypothetical protein